MLSEKKQERRVIQEAGREGETHFRKDAQGDLSEEMIFKLRLQPY